MKKSDKIAMTAIIAGIVMLTFLGIAWTMFKPIRYGVQHQYPVTCEFALRGSTIIPESGVEIAPNNYSYFFVESFGVPEVSPEKNITVIATYADVWWGSNGPFRVYIFDAENFEKWRNGEPCSTIWKVKPEEIGEINYEDHHWFPISRSQNLYIVFENTHIYNLHLTVEADSIVWCKQITGYRTEYLTRYNYTPVNTRSCLLILAIMSMIAGEIHIARAKAFSILLISIVIVALVVLVVYHKLESNKAYEELHRSRVYEAYLDANDISRKIGWFTYKFYDEVYDLNRWLRSEAFNGTKESIISAKCGFLRTYAERYWLDIRRDLSDLSRLTYLDKEIPFLNSSAFKTVHDAIREALGQVEWTTLGKTWEEILNETPETLWELYYVLGVNQVEQEQPESGLLALDRCFSKLYSYWYSEATYGKGNMPHDATPPRIALEWAVGNATALHQELIQWDKYHSPLLPD